MVSVYTMSLTEEGARLAAEVEREVSARELVPALLICGHGDLKSEDAPRACRDGHRPSQECRSALTVGTRDELRGGHDHPRALIRHLDV